MITCEDSASLHKLLHKLAGTGLEFHATDAFILKGATRASVMITAEEGILERICAIANFVNDYQI